MHTIQNHDDGLGDVTLQACHASELQASAIGQEAIRARGYRSITTPDQLPQEFKGEQRTLTGLLIPVRDHTGQVATYQLKADTPRLDKNGKPIKYETAIGGRTCIDVPAEMFPFLRDMSQPLWVTEGAKKVDSALTYGIGCVLGLLGVWSWRAGAALPYWHFITLQGREVVVAFDSDVMRKHSVRKALDDFSEFLDSQGAKVRYCLMPDLADGGKCGLDDWFVNGGTVDALQPLLVDVLPEPELDWDPPIPLFNAIPPPFLTTALPPILATYVEAVSVSTQTPPDLAGAVVLGTLSAAIRGTVDVAGPTWTEPLVLQVMAVAEPGSRKSAVIKSVTEPIRTWERDQRSGDLIALAQWESQLRVLEKELDRAEKKALTDQEDPALESIVQRLWQHKVARPVVTRILLDDATPEATVSTLCEQGGPAAVISAEPSFFSNIAGRYQDSPNLDALLKGHAGDAITVARKGRESEETDRAALTICVTVQPDVVRDLGKTQGFQGRGGAARLLPAIIPDMRGKADLDAPGLAEYFVAGWKILLLDLLAQSSRRLKEAPGKPLLLTMDNEAAAEFRKIREASNRAMGPGGTLDRIPDWGAKLDGTILRIAGTLHVAEHGLRPGKQISSETMERASALGEYFVHHALTLYRMMGTAGDESLALEVLEAIKAQGLSFTKRDLFRALHQRWRFQKIGTLDAPLADLEAKGWIRARPIATGKRGRPSQRYDVNPFALIDDDGRSALDGVFVNIVMEHESPQIDPTVSPLLPLADSGGHDSGEAAD